MKPRDKHQIGFRRARDQEGTALILSLFLITVLTVLGTMVLNTSIVEIKMAQNQKISSQVFYAAEAGLERGLIMLIKDFEGDTVSGSPWGNANYAGWAETVTESANTGSATFDPDIRSLDMYTTSPDANLKKLTLAGGHTVHLNTFDLYIYKIGSNEAYVMSHAYGNGGTAAVEYHLKVDDFSPYNNAIFTGAGIAGHFNGSVNVAGSVYSRGTLDIGANVNFTNNYSTGHHALVSGDTLYDMIIQESDLDSKVRVKGGDLTLGGGSVQFGFAGTNNSLAGVYVDGATNIDAVGTHYYDEYQSEVPDVPMPSILEGLEGEHGEAQIAACRAAQGYAGNDAAVAMSMYAAWAEGTQCWAGSGSRGAVLHGDLTIDQTTPTGWLVGPDADNNGVYYTAPGSFPGMGSIDVQGTVVITGDLSFGDNQLDGLEYTATGPGPASDPTEGATLVVGGNITADGAFYPPDGYLKGITSPAPNDINSLGIVTPGDINFTGHNDDIHAGFFYAEGQVNFNKQSKFAGTVIGGLVNYAQVPDVYQVPNLKNYLPPAIPGGQNVMKLSNREWRRVY